MTLNFPTSCKLKKHFNELENTFSPLPYLKGSYAYIFLYQYCMYLGVVGWKIPPKRKTMTSGKMLESLVY